MNRSCTMILAAAAALAPAALASGQTDLAWFATYDYLNNWVDRADAIAVDEAGNVYVTGSSRETSSSYDYATIKYDADGNELWVRRYNGAGNFIDQAFDIALDAAGNVYVAGHSWGGGNFGTPPKYDVVTLKYAPDGTLVWEHRYNSVYDNDDFFSDMEVTSAGEVYITGFSYTPIGQPADADYTTYKLGADGTLLWQHFYDGPQDLLEWLSNSLVLDDAGNAYMAAVVALADNWNVFGLCKYAADGTIDWETSWAQPALPNGLPDFTVLYDVTVDSGGNVILAGRYLAGPDWETINSEAAVIKFDPAGQHLWTQINSTPEADEFRRVITDAAGTIYLEGAFNVDNGSWLHADNLVAAYAADGTFLWEHRYGGTGEGFDGDGFITLDADGNVVVGIETVDDVTYADFMAIVYDPATGAVLRQVSLDFGGDETALGLAVDGAGAIYLTGAGWLDDATGYGYLTVKINPAGGPVIPGDVNGDGVVDLVDLLALLAAWGPCGAECPADLNGDGFVDIADLLLLLSNWS